MLACERSGAQRLLSIARPGTRYKQLYAPDCVVESRRKMVGFTQSDLQRRMATSRRRGFSRRAPCGTTQSSLSPCEASAWLSLDWKLATADVSPGAPYDEFLQLIGIDEEGRIALQMWFDVEDIDSALAELDATNARFEEQHSQLRRLENAATRINDRVGELFGTSRWDEIGALFANEVRVDDWRRGLQRESNDHATEVANLRAVADLGIVNISATPLALRGNRLCLSHVTFRGRDEFGTETLAITEIDDGSIMTMIAFDLEDIDAAIAELDARYLAGEAAAHARTWSVITLAYAALNRREMPPTTPSWVNVDHRHGMSFGPGELPALLAAWNLAPDVSSSIEVVHRLNNLGAVVTSASHETSREGVNAEWRVISMLTVEGDLINRLEVFDEADIDAAIARFDQLSRPARRLENAASQMVEAIPSAFCGPRLGRHGGDTGQQHFNRGSSSCGECRHPAGPRC